MPENRSLSEYVAILHLLSRLLFKLLEHVSKNQWKSALYVCRISTTIGLLVSQVVSADAILSNATIGFSLCGNQNERRKCIQSRKENLPLLSNVSPHKGLDWSPGNCAEPENFAYLPWMHEQLRQSAVDNGLDNAEIISMSLSLKWFDQYVTSARSAKVFCKICRETADLMSGSLSCKILDLCPQ